MKETKKIESANVVANNAKAATAAPTPKQGKKTEEAKPMEVEQPKTAEQLQNEIDQRTAELQKKLQELEAKQKLNRNRSKFIETLDNLAEFEEKLNVDDSFETGLFRIKFCSIQNYRENDLFSVSNTSVLLDLIAFMRERIKNKVSDIEKLLLQ